MQKTNAHGGNIYKAAQNYGIKKEEILDFSANINPLGIPKSVREMIIGSVDQLVNYPDPECSELKQAISCYLKVPEQNIIIGNGASEVIFLLLNVLNPGKVLIPAPSFSEYAKAAQSCGVEVEYLELKEDRDYKLSINDLFERMTGGVKAVILCNPNNPTSTLTDRDTLIRIVKFASTRGIYVVIDEAFIELTVEGNRNSIVDEVANFHNLFVIRAFTKLFAIPGLRLGYGIGNPEVIKKMWERKMPWSINTFACSLGTVLTKEQEYLARSSCWLKNEIEWLYAALVSIPGLKVFKPNTNFILVKILTDTLSAGLLRDRMAARGVLIRDASNFTYLNDKFFRVAVKDRESNKKMIEVLQAALSVNEN